MIASETYCLDELKLYKIVFICDICFRYDRSRSRDRSRSYSGSRDRDSISPVHRRDRSSDKEKINKYADGDGDPIRHEGPLSEGEDRDDYTSTDTKKLIDRDAFAGKWAEKEDGGGGDRGPSAKEHIPSETNMEEMDKFLDKVKKDKKEEMLERNKDLLKSKTW